MTTVLFKFSGQCFGSAGKICRYRQRNFVCMGNRQPDEQSHPQAFAKKRFHRLILSVGEKSGRKFKRCVIGSAGKCSWTASDPQCSPKQRATQRPFACSWQRKQSRPVLVLRDPVHS